MDITGITHSNFLQLSFRQYKCLQVEYATVERLNKEFK